MREVIVGIVGVAALVVLGAGPAWAAGPSGSSEDHVSHEVSCDAGTTTPVGTIYVSPAGASGPRSNGVEACSDDDELIDGRIIVDADDGYASIDGDPTNAALVSPPGRPRFLEGFARVGAGGVRCDQDHTYWDSTTQGGECRP